MGVTDSTQEFTAALRTQLLTYTDGGPAPNTIDAAVSGRVYQDSPPPLSSASYPYLVVSLVRLPASPDTDYHRRGLQVEVIVIDRPRAKLARAQRLADLADKAMTQWRVATATDGSVLLRPPTIQPLPVGPSDTDRELIQIRVLSDAGYAWWRAA